LPALARAGLAHLYFVCIHPFEDGNGRLARALAEKALAQNLAQPSLSSLSQIIQKRRKAYYDALARNNRDLEVTDWLVWFGEAVLEAQLQTQRLISFLIEKTRLYDRVRGQLNARQDKALARMFREGPEGFKGGLSVANYIAITGAPRATATRDLQQLVAIDVLRRTGTLKSTRYHLTIAGIVG
jgi:Fic family protein